MWCFGNSCHRDSDRWANKIPGFSGKQLCLCSDPDFLLVGSSICHSCGASKGSGTYLRSTAKELSNSLVRLHLSSIVIALGAFDVFFFPYRGITLESNSQIYS